MIAPPEIRAEVRAPAHAELCLGMACNRHRHSEGPSAGSRSLLIKLDRAACTEASGYTIERAG